MTNDEIIRNYYSGWERKDRSAVGKLLAGDFIFTSPNDDPPLDKPAFLEKCWPEAQWIDRFELESVTGGTNSAFVRYVCRTNYGTSFRNVEYFRIADGKIQGIEVYFGGRQGHPSQYASNSSAATDEGAPVA